MSFVLFWFPFSKWSTRTSVPKRPVCPTLLEDRDVAIRMRRIWNVETWFDVMYKKREIAWYKKTWYATPLDEFSFVLCTSHVTSHGLENRA